MTEEIPEKIKYTRNIWLGYRTLICVTLSQENTYVYVNIQTHDIILILFLFSYKCIVYLLPYSRCKYNIFRWRNEIPYPLYKILSSLPRSYLQNLIPTSSLFYLHFHLSICHTCPIRMSIGFHGRLDSTALEHRSFQFKYLSSDVSLHFNCLCDGLCYGFSVQSVIYQDAEICFQTWMSRHEQLYLLPFYLEMGG